MSYAISQRTGIKPSDGRWLLMAVMLHVVVLLIPLRELPPGTITGSAALVVRLVLGKPTVSPGIVSEKVIPESEPVREVLGPKPKVAKMLDLTAPETVPEEQAELTPEVTTARLFGLRDTLTDKVPRDSGSGLEDVPLGELRPFNQPHNWQPHAGAVALKPFDNTFNGMSVPEKVQIVDRWLAADGSHNVVVVTPTGLRLCGRAAAWDPMNPLVEQVTQFRICGGDGAIPFIFKPRKPLNRDFIETVAKDATQP